MSTGAARLETAKTILDRQLGWITAAEAKAGFVVAIDTAMIAGLAAAYNNADVVRWFGATASTVTALLVMTSILCAGMVVRSRVDGPARSLLFFGAIAKMDADAYRAALKTISQEGLLDDFARQIHRNAEIASAKHTWSRRSINGAIAAGVTWAISISILVQG